MQCLNEGFIALIQVGEGLTILHLHYPRINDVFQVGNAEIPVRKYEQGLIRNGLIGLVPKNTIFKKTPGRAPGVCDF